MILFINRLENNPGRLIFEMRGKAFAIIALMGFMEIA